MGLLDKANSTHLKQNSPDVNSVNEPTESDILPILIDEIKQLPLTVDFGTQFFRLLCKNYSIAKAVLFFKSNEENIFNSLCSSGYDITTSNRLRLDKSFFTDKNIIENLSRGLPFLLPKPDCLLKGFFSLREYGLLEEIYFVPVYQDKDLLSLILISEWNEFPPSAWTEQFQSISETVSLPLRKSRMALVNSEIKYDIDEDIPDLEDSLRTIMRSADSNDLYLIELNLSILFRELLNENSGLTAVNIKKEILSVFKTMSGGDVDIIELQNSRILLIQNQNRISDIDLYLYQLAASLPLLYTSLESAPDLQPEVREYKANSDIEVIIKDLI